MDTKQKMREIILGSAAFDVDDDFLAFWDEYLRRGIDRGHLTKALCLCGYRAIVEAQRLTREFADDDRPVPDDEAQETLIPEDRLQQLVDIAMRACSAPISDLERRCIEAEVATRAFDREREGARESARVAAERDQYRRLYEDMRETLSGASALARAAEISTLQSELQLARNRMAILEKTAAGRGNAGEFALAAWFRTAFKDADVVDASAQPASCDLHVSFASDSFFVAVESKNKAVVRREDVEKFYRDVDSLSTTRGAALRGALFVSLETATIPGKGSFAFELRRGIPVCFVGFAGANIDDLAFLQKCTAILLDVAASVSCMRGSERDVADMQRALRPNVAKLEKMRKEVESIKAAAGKIVKSCDHVYEGMAGILDEVERIVGHHHHVAKNNQVESWRCTGCGRSYASKRGLQVHAGKCRAVTSND